MAHEYIRVTKGWDISTHEWHKYDMRENTSNRRMSYKYIRVTKGWHTSTYE